MNELTTDEQPGPCKLSPAGWTTGQRCPECGHYGLMHAPKRGEPCVMCEIEALRDELKAQVACGE